MNFPLSQDLKSALIRLMIQATILGLPLLFLANTAKSVEPSADFTSPPKQPTTAVAASIAAVEATPTPSPTIEPTATPAARVGTKFDWYLAAGIPAPWVLVDWLVSKESSWNPNAINPSSGACGLGQQLACGKWPHQWNDPVGALQDMHAYVMGRYGSWDNAVAFHRSHGWY